MSAGGAISSAADMVAGILSFIGNAAAWDNKSYALQADMQAADDNAQLAAAASADALHRGEIESAKLRLRGSQAASQMQAAYAAGGVDATVGTPADMQQYQAAVTELDAQTAENNAWREAFGFQKQKAGFERQRSNLRAQHKAEQEAYSLNQVGTLVKTAASGWKMGLEMSGG